MSEQREGEPRGMCSPAPGIDYSQLDPGIRLAVKVLREFGAHTIESCQGGEGHVWQDPTVTFGGSYAEGIYLLGVVLMHPYLKVNRLQRTWRILDGEIEGPIWEMSFIGPLPEYAP